MHDTATAMASDGVDAHILTVVRVNPLQRCVSRRRCRRASQVG